MNFKRRALRHHLPIAAAALTAVILSLVHSKRGVQRWILATASVALVLLAATWALYRDGVGPVSSTDDANMRPSAP